MTPNEYSNTERRRRGQDSRKGNFYLRMLLIHGARAMLLADKYYKTRSPKRLTQLQCWILQTAERIGHNSCCGISQRVGANLPGGVVPRATFQRQLAKRKARLTAE